MVEIFLSLKTNKKFANIRTLQTLVDKLIKMSKREINITT
jgi:hypothetical protein